MSSGTAGMTRRIQATKLNEAVEEIKNWINNFNLPALGTFIDQTNSQLAYQQAVINGLVDMLGKDAVQAAVYKVQEDGVNAKLAGEKAKLDQAVSEGYISVDTAIQEASLLLTRENGPDGRGMDAKAWAFISLPDQFKSLFLGKGKGVSAPTPNGGSLEVVEVYLVDEAKAKTLIEAAQQGAMAAQQVAQAQTAANAAPAAPTDAPATAPTDAAPAPLASVPADATPAPATSTT